MDEDNQHKWTGNFGDVSVTLCLSLFCTRIKFLPLQVSQLLLLGLKSFMSRIILACPQAVSQRRENLFGWGIIVCFLSFSLITHEYRVKEAIIKVESSKNWISSKKQIGHLLFVILVVCFSFYALSKR